ncbi:LssY C-terminal domain-containing protein [Actinomyces slackii]|uniref:LssY-like C-terminal domain-containing protein n=1 Tax=Actinomyces slackii TaxID=52774 RepID=A0A448KAN4_9ACTO|nr:LssY C-terminal domain-containing protein [Actinomyces slackii]VEG73988.1 Uncharacterised protein [Actinomyces slackii]
MSERAATRPRPTAPPVYQASREKLTEAEVRSWGVDDVVDALFFAVAALAALWLAWLILGAGWHLTPWAVVAGLAFWGMLAYLAIPRLHQVLTWLYVPDYFIGRTRTPDGLLGDPVNLAIQGDEDDIHEAMRSAGWVRADPITLASSWGIIKSWMLRRSYPAAPVSTLQLFGRAQDFAYQKEVEGNPSQRHHIRFWHTPSGWVLPGGRGVDWLAAATYDRAVGLSGLTLQVTHRIDADIDIERNYVVDDLRWACPQARLSIWTDFFTSYHDKNGGGDRVITDGDLYVLDLEEVVADSRHSVELARARAADAQAQRNRPIQLLVALALIAALTVTNVVIALGGRNIARVVQEAEAYGLVDAAANAYVMIATISGFLALAAAGLGVAAWHGHPRGRIALLMALTLRLLMDFSQVTGMGVRQVSVGLLTTSALTVLALLTLTARPVPRWERARKAERRRRRAGGKRLRRAGLGDR